MQYVKALSTLTLLVTTGLAGCGNASGDDDSDASTMGEPSTSSADDNATSDVADTSDDDGRDSTSAGGSDDSNDSDGSDGATSETGDACELPTDASPLSIEITIENTRAVPIYLQNARATECMIEVPFEIRDARNAVISWTRIEGETACADALDPNACAYECGAVQPRIRIEPGASYVITWDGLDHRASEVPATCTDACADTCFVGETIEAGPLVFTAIGSESCGNPDGCPCSEPADVCSDAVETGNELEDPETITAELEFPTETSVTLSF